MGVLERKVAKRKGVVVVGVSPSHTITARSVGAHTPAREVRHARALNGLGHSVAEHTYLIVCVGEWVGGCV